LLLYFRYQKNDLSSNFLKKHNINHKDFEKEIFSFFSFNNEDIETYKELDNKYINAPTAYPTTIYSKIVGQAFGIKGTESLYDLYKN
jgi:hypothetical protein